MGTSELMVAAARSQRSPFSSPIRVRLEGGVPSPLGKRKQIVVLITHEQWLSGQRGVRSWVVSPETATSATWTLTQHGSLSPGLCRSLVKESYSSSPVRVLLSCWGTREYNQTGESHLRSYRNNKTRHRRSDRKGIPWKLHEVGNACVTNWL